MRRYEQVLVTTYFVIDLKEIKHLIDLLEYFLVARE